METPTLLDHKSDLPLHRQIEQQLRELIATGAYDEGQLFPKEVDLSERYGVSRNTVRQAINTLVAEGLLQRKKGVGTTVCQQSISTQLSKWHSFTQEMSDKGIPLRNFELSFERLQPDEGITTLMGLPTDTPMDCLKRLRGDEKGPFVYFISWFHPTVQFAEGQDFERPLYDILEQELQIVPQRSEEEVSAVLAKADLAEKLGVKKGAPILKRKRRVYDVQNRLIEYNIGYYRADQFTYKIDINRSIITT